MAYCSFNGLNIFYEDQGCGIPIIFIHPPGMGRKVFHFQRLLTNQFRIILLDLSGHGDSIGNQQFLSIENYANEVLALMDHLDLQKAVVCGYSSGGIVAQELALSYPERIHTIILSGGFPKVDTPILKYEHLLGMYVLKNYPKLIRYTIAAAHTWENELKNELIQHMKKANQHSWYTFYEKSLAYDCTDRLHQMEVPLFLIYGSKDFLNNHIHLYEKVNQVKLHIIQKAAHQLPMKNWSVFNEIVGDFVTSLFD